MDCTLRTIEETLVDTETPCAIFVWNLQVGYHFVLPSFIALFIVLIIHLMEW